VWNHGEAIVRGLLRAGRLKAEQIFATDRRSEVVKALPRQARQSAPPARTWRPVAPPAWSCRVKPQRGGHRLNNDETRAALAGKLVGQHRRRHSPGSAVRLAAKQRVIAGLPTPPV